MMSRFIDLGLIGVAMRFLPVTDKAAPLIYWALIIAYYIGLELWIGRTLGKFFFGFHLATQSGQKPGIGFILLRNLLRCFPVLAVVSWRRVSLLDLLSGIRAVRDIPKVRGRGARLQEPAELGWR